jgi:4-diphosphocytidyl-2-C-methyl-D-erythritol kinase
VRRAPATAKLNLALVVGPQRTDGRHEVATVMQRLDLADRVSIEPAPSLRVDGFREDTLVRSALERLAEAADREPAWRARIWKHVPVAAGLGGGSSDAAVALRLADETLVEPLPPERLHTVARSLGADVPFFLTSGPQLGTGDGSTLEPLQLPRGHVCVLVLPHGATKESTAAVYDRFAASGRAAGFADRRARLLEALARNDLASLPRNDLASSPLAAELEALGAVRADVSGAGPTVYGLFREADEAARAAAELEPRGRVWIAGQAW